MSDFAMPGPQACPDDQTLKRFLLGRIPDAETGALEEHLFNCDQCSRALEALATEDELAVSLPAFIAPALEGSAAEPENLEKRLMQRVGGGIRDLTGLRDFEILREIGRGGMGVVYRARDIRRDEVVALKTMRRFDPAALYRFKQEFRSLAGLSHRNLVALYDLIAEGEEWFFTMEFVEGVNFLDYVCRPGGSQAPGTGSVTESPEADSESTYARTPDAVARLRQTLRQLAEGVSFLHEAGKLHRDLKPSNVLVNAEGRVVVLDFGLATELNRAGLHQSTEQHLVGTVAYMAPEQGTGQAITTSADWYSVGVMLYEALTGRLPYRGPPLQVLHDKEQRDPSAPRDLTDEVPEDLNSLCMELLRRDPGARPTGREVLRKLENRSVETRIDSVVPAVPQQRLPLVGRERHLAALEDALGGMRQGRTVVVYVHGRSGMGKSALVEYFLDDLIERHAAVVLAGRCYEQESVPYKALDSLVDALSHYWRRLPDAQAQALLPRDIHALARVFPVLRQVDAVSYAPGRETETPDQQELRRRAFGALRELMTRLGDRKPLVLFIDDLQWGDVDSAALLLELLRPPDPPVLLLLGTYRSEDVPRSKCLQALFRSQDTMALDRRELAVEALDPAEARDLAAALLGDHVPAAQLQAESIGRESGGSPYLIYELVQSVESHPGEIAGLDEVLWTRISRLPDTARRFLEVISVAGRPLRQMVASSVAEPGPEERTALATLRSGRLIRGTGLTEQDEIETYHDRIRETIVARLAPSTLADYHGRLAAVLEGSGGTDPEVLAIHCLGSGALERAGHFFALAADQAAAALAFDRAAKLYRRALELVPLPVSDGRLLRARLGDALANAGRGAEAAREYVTAAAESSAAEALDLQKRAAFQLLISGHVDEGLTALYAVLHQVGIRLPPTPRRTLLALLFRQFQLRLRGIGFRERAVDDVSSEDISRIDLLWSASIGLSMIDPIQGAHLQTRNLLLALRTGEPLRIARSLALESGHLAVLGGRARRRSTRLLDAADEIAKRGSHPHLAGLILLVRGITAYFDERWKMCQSLSEQAEQLFRNRCVGVWWERDTAQVLSLSSLMHLGELAEPSQRTPSIFREAQERGDLYALTTAIGTFVRPFLDMAADKPEDAQRELSEVLKQWSHHGFHLQHANGIYRQVEIELYRGDSDAANRRASQLWSAFASSLLTRLRYLRILMHHLCARTALAAAQSSIEPKLLLKTAERLAKRLEGERSSSAGALRKLILAGIASTRNQKSIAVRELADAADGFDAIDMRLYAVAARRRLGQLSGGHEGRTLVDQADAWMTSQMIQNPARMTAMLAPGFSD